MTDYEITERIVHEVEDLKKQFAGRSVAKPMYTMINWAKRASLSADSTGYNIENYDAVLINPTGVNRTIHGFTNGIPGRILRVMNASITLSLLFPHQSASAAADNRLSTTTLATITLAPRQWTAFLYVDDVNVITGATRWLMIYPSA